jgi:hypothetical protein
MIKGNLVLNKCGKMNDYNNNNKNDYKCCRMITNTLDIMIIEKINLAISF